RSAGEPFGEVVPVDWLDQAVVARPGAVEAEFHVEVIRRGGWGHRDSVPAAEPVRGALVGSAASAREVDGFPSAMENLIVLEAHAIVRPRGPAPGAAAV